MIGIQSIEIYSFMQLFTYHNSGKPAFTERSRWWINFAERMWNMPLFLCLTVSLLCMADINVSTEWLQRKMKAKEKCEKQFYQKRLCIVETCSSKWIHEDVNKHKAANVERLGSQFLISGCREILSLSKRWNTLEEKI